MQTKKLKIKIHKTVLTATLFDNPTTKDFISMLPLKLSLSDYASTEKISDLSKRLTKKDAPAGSEASSGHIGYYEPWGNLAIFYKDFDFSKGLILLGKIDSDLKPLMGPETLDAKIELAE
jgi:hypothetical protein